MGFLDRFRAGPTPEEQTEKEDRLDQEQRIVTKEASIEEQKAIAAEAKSRYGINWKEKLNIIGKVDWGSVKRQLETMQRGHQAVGEGFHRPQMVVSTRPRQENIHENI